MNISVLIETLGKIMADKRNAVVTARLIEGGEKHGADEASERSA